MGNASMDDTDAVAASTFFFATDGKSFVNTFNCSIYNMSKYQMSRLLVHLCLQASSSSSDMTSSMGSVGGS
jgi:hypothetical protein